MTFTDFMIVLTIAIVVIALTYRLIKYYKAGGRCGSCSYRDNCTTKNATHCSFVDEYRKIYPKSID